MLVKLVIPRVFVSAWVTYLSGVECVEDLEIRADSVGDATLCRIESEMASEEKRKGSRRLETRETRRPVCSAKTANAIA